MKSFLLILALSISVGATEYKPVFKPVRRGPPPSITLESYKCCWHLSLDHKQEACCTCKKKRAALDENKNKAP